MRATVNTPYPNLTVCLVELSNDNEMPLKPRDQWDWPHNVQELESLAGTCTTQELLEMSSGCWDDEVEPLLKARPELQPLHGFLECVFDGDQTSRFFL